MEAGAHFTLPLASVVRDCRVLPTLNSLYSVPWIEQDTAWEKFTSSRQSFHARPRASFREVLHENCTYCCFVLNHVLDCGLKSRRSRPQYSINDRGGQDVGTQYSFVGRVLIRYREDDGWYACTGSLIYRRWLLTAAHCYVEDAEAKDMVVCMPSDGCAERWH